MLRILGPDGKIEPGRKAPEMAPEDLIRLYRLMLMNRRVDERMTGLQRQGRIGFYIGSPGEEAAIIGSAFALEKEDWIVPCYRELGAILLRGFSLFELCCQLFGNAQDPIKGRQMPNHYASRELKFCSISSPVGTQIPHAVGIGLAARLAGRKDVALVYFGDGATSQGDFHVALNFAGVYKAQTIFLCRNNQWAISVPLKKQTASEGLAVKAGAYGISGVRVDGNDVFAVISATRDAVQAARNGEGPTLIEAVTYRLGAHSTSDDPRVYRPEGELEAWTGQDPLVRLRAYLQAQNLWSEKENQALEQEIREEIQDAVRRAENIGPPVLRTVFEDVFDEMPWHLKEQWESAEAVVEHEAVEQEAL